MGEGRFAESLKAVGGLEAVKEACAAAAAKHGLRETVKKMSVSPVMAAKKTAKALSEEEHILEFLRSHLSEILKEETAEMYANSIRVAMSKQGITTMKSAEKHIGKKMGTAQEIIALANVQLQAPVLSGWFQGLEAGTLFPERSDLLKESDMAQAELKGSSREYWARLHP